MNAVTGNFTYPPQNQNLQFDYRDSVVASWVTDDSHAVEGVLSLWYWLLNGHQNWTIAVIEAVPANGSKSVALDIGTTSDFLAQFNINYNSDDGAQQKYDSPIINVATHPGEVSPVTWNQQALSTTSVASTKPSILQAAPTDGSTTSSATTSASTFTGAPEQSSPQLHSAATTSASTSTGALKTSSPKLHSAAAIGLGVGITFGMAAMGLIGFLYWKTKKNSDRRRSVGMSQKPAAFVNQGKIVGELDAHHRHPELSVGRPDAELDGGRSTL